MKKRLFAAILALSMICSAVPAFAATTGDSPNVDILGTVEAISAIDVDVPLNMTFIINADRSITYPQNVKITSRTPAPLTVKLYSAAPGSGAPALVADDTFSDWDNLTEEQTLANIALSLNSVNLTEAGQSLGKIGTGYVGPAELPLNLTALYGKIWLNTVEKRFTYDVALEIGLDFSEDAIVSPTEDTTVPTITSASAVGTVVTINATDNGRVAAYALSTTNTAPSSDWQTSNSIDAGATGTYYAFAKDVAGNISVGYEVVIS